MGSLAAFGLAASIAVGYFLGQLFELGCSENVEPGTTQDDVCAGVGELWSFTWWLAVLWPAVVLALTLLIPRLDRHEVAVVAVIGLMMAAFWTPLLLAVTGNVG